MRSIALLFILAISPWPSLTAYSQDTELFKIAPPEGVTIEDNSLAKRNSYFKLTLASVNVGEDVHSGPLKNTISRITREKFYALPKGKFRYVDAASAEMRTISSTIDLSSSSFDAQGEDLGRIRAFNKDLVGPIPYFDGSVQIELGFFAAKQTDIIQNFLGVLSSITPLVQSIPGAQTSVGSYLTGAQGLGESISEALDNIVGSDDGVLLLGYTTDQGEKGLLSESGYYAFVYKGSAKNFDANDYSLREAGTSGKEVALFRKNRNGDFEEATKISYMILQVEISNSRGDVSQIPGYRNLQSAWREAMEKPFGIDENQKLSDLDWATKNFINFLASSPYLSNADKDEYVAWVADSTREYLCRVSSYVVSRNSLSNNCTPDLRSLDPQTSEDQGDLTSLTATEQRVEYYNRVLAGEGADLIKNLRFSPEAVLRSAEAEALARVTLDLSEREQ